MQNKLLTIGTLRIFVEHKEFAAKRFRIEKKNVVCYCPARQKWENTLRIYLLCLLVRPVTYIAFLGGIAAFVLGQLFSGWLNSQIPDLPAEVLEALYRLHLYYALSIAVVPIGAAWEARKIYWKIYPYILRDGPERYWAVTRFHGGCFYTAFRMAEYHTRKLRTNN